MATDTVTDTEQTALLDFGGSKQQCLDELGNCGQKVVDLSFKLEKEQIANEDNLKDSVAIGVAVGMFIGSGGISAIAPVIGGLVALPFALLGF